MKSFGKKAAVATLLLLPLLFVSCNKDKRPADVMDEQQMVDFLSEAYLLEGFYAVESGYQYDALTPQMLRAYDSILAAQGLDRETVEKSFDYYVTHLDTYQVIQDSVLARIEAYEKKMETPEE
jgi:hypothetical protein